MDPALFLADLEEKPARLADLAAALRAGDRWGVASSDAERTWLLLGMGSSAYAAQVAAARLRSRGVPAVAELAATDLLPPVDARTTVVAITASGGSAETLDACRRLRAQSGGARFIAMTNVVDSAVVDLCDDVVPMWAGPEAGGVACRTFQHTLALLLALDARLAGSGRGGDPVPDLLDRAAEASAFLLDSRDDWLTPVSEALLGPQGTHVVAPARRLELGPPVGADAARGPAASGVRLRDGGLEPRRRVPDQDHGLPDAAVRRLPVGGRAAAVGPRARVDPGRGRRRRRRRRRHLALPPR